MKEQQNHTIRWNQINDSNRRLTTIEMGIALQTLYVAERKK